LSEVKYFIIKITMLAALCLTSSVSYAKKNIPIPPERPKILNVTPSYLDELSRKGEPVSKNILNKDKKKKKPAPSTLNPENSMKSITSQDIFNILENKKIEENKVIAVNDIFSDSSDETLISFPLKPTEVKFDESTISFLAEHVMGQLHSQPNKTIEIRSYATAIPGEEHSKIRISLARALEIRKFMIDNGIDAQRIKLNTLGDQNTQIHQDDRIDLVLYK